MLHFLTVWCRSERFPAAFPAQTEATFWVGDVLHATMASTFSTSQLPKAVRKWGAFSFLTWKCASRHNGVTFSTSQLPKAVRTWGAFSFLTWKCASRHNGVTFSTSQLPKAVRTWGAFSFLTWKCASRHNGVHFCDISTSKSGPNVRWLLAFWLGNVLRATNGVTFSTSQLPKAVRTWGAFSFLTWTCASRHNDVQPFISHLTTSQFFDPPEPQIIGKTQGIANFLPFRSTCLFFLLTLSPLWSSLFFSSPLWLFPPLLFQLSILSEISLLDFLR